MRLSRDGGGVARRIVAWWVALAAVGVPRPFAAAAQEPAASFEELGSRLSVGDTVFLVDGGGTRSKGTIAALSATSLRLLVDGIPRDFPEADVRQVDRRSSDSVLNGLLIGAAIGGALFLRYYSENALCQVNCQFVSGALGMIGIGAGVGAGIDALVIGRKTMFRRRWSMPQGATSVR